MNKIIDSIFKFKKPNFEKLLDFGFTKINQAYFYETKIFDDQFLLKIFIDNSDIKTEVVEIETDEPYTLFLAENVVGNFVGTVKAEYEKVLTTIASKCFDTEIFKSKQAKDLVSYCELTFKDELEFLWKDLPSTAILRRSDTKKWYAIFMTLSKRKFGIESDELVDVIDLRTDTQIIDKIVDNTKVFKGYHMNKKHWISIFLNDSLSLKELIKHLHKSYELAL